MEGGGGRMEGERERGRKQVRKWEDQGRGERGRGWTEGRGREEREKVERGREREELRKVRGRKGERNRSGTVSKKKPSKSEVLCFVYLTSLCLKNIIMTLLQLLVLC